MADSERRVFPIETVLALAAGKKDCDLREIAGYILGESINCNCKALVAAPFAAAWIARLYPKFADLVWNEEKETWSNFVVRGAQIFGDKVSLPAMAGGMKATCQAVLKTLADKHDEVSALQREVAALTAQVETLKPLEAKLAAAQKKADQFEAQLKDQKKEMGALRRQTMEFQGKMALNEEELLDTIKNAIKGDEFGFGGGADEFGFGGGADEFGFGGGAGFGGEAAAPAEEKAPADEFGFGDSGKDEFGF